MIPSRPRRESDQTYSDSDQGAADLDQLAADSDQAASDRDLAHGADRTVYDDSREARIATTQARRATSLQRRATAIARGATARGLKLVELQRDIDRARVSSGGLIAAYVDVDNLTAIGQAGSQPTSDAVLERLVAELQAAPRPCESVVRLGGDEFLCTFSDTTIDAVRERFDEIKSKLNLTPDDVTVTVGFAELARGDSPLDLIDRADRALITSRAQPGPPGDAHASSQRR